MFLNLLATATSAVQTVLLDSASWLARLDRIPQDQFKVFTQVLLALLESNTLDVRADALTALGHLRAPSSELSEVIERLPTLPTDHGSRFTYYVALVPLAARGDAEEREPVFVHLRDGLSDEGAMAALVRLIVTMTDKEVDSGTLHAASPSPR